MTLVLALANSRYAVQLSDRRLSWGGTPVTEQANKATIVVCANARLALGMAGIAHVGAFNTDDWIINTLSDYTGSRFDGGSIFQWFSERVTEEFARNPDLLSLTPSQRRLSVMLTGYLGAGSSALLANALVTNYQDAETLRDSADAWDKFRTYFSVQKEGSANPTLIQRIGAWQAMKDEDELPLRALLEADPPPPTLVGAGVGYIRSIADRPAAGGTIGKSVSSIVISRDGAQPIAEMHYHEGVDAITSVNYVLLLPDQRFAAKQMEIRRVDAKVGEKSFIPKVGRNKPCPCGTGKKYKKCHGDPTRQ